MSARLAQVALYSVASMLATPLGMLPLVAAPMTARNTARASAVTAGVMLAASTELVLEAPVPQHVVLGALVGALCTILVRRLCYDPKDIAQTRMLLLVIVMTAHSFAEGLGIGVSFSGGFGTSMSTAIAIHNIPEGLSLALVLLPQGVSTSKTVCLCLLSSLPQPLVAIPSYILCESFRGFLSYGYGCAAGAMLYVVYIEILPDAFNHDMHASSSFLIAASFGAMMLLQNLM